MNISSYKMLSERQQNLLDLLNSGNYISIRELSEKLGFSQPTVRRDIQWLSEMKLVDMIRGGAKISQHAGASQGIQQRTAHWEEKLRIGAAAADLVQDNEVIAINTSTTCMAMASYLLEKSNLTVVTSDIEIAELLSSKPDFEVYIVGGMIQKDVPGILGSEANEIWQSFRFDKCFMGIRALHPEVGLMTTKLDRAENARTLFKNSIQKIVIADSSKFQNRTAVVICPMNMLDVLVTDTGVYEDVRLMEQLNQIDTMKKMIV